MLVARIQRGLFRLCSVLPRLKMAEETAVAMVSQTPEPGPAPAAAKRPLDPDADSTSEATAAATATPNGSALSAAAVHAFPGTNVVASPAVTSALSESSAVTTSSDSATSTSAAKDTATAVTSHTCPAPSTSEVPVEGTASDSQEPAAKKLKTADEESDSSLNRLVKRKVAMLLSYSGVGYKGMQKNPGELTIEEDLATALVKCGAIMEEHAQAFGKMAFQRCARTDKGVSASGQTVSLKMKLLDNVVDRINEHLPPCIKVMGVKRTTASFNSKHNCDYRTYMYMVPTFAFAPMEQMTAETYRLTADKQREINELLAFYVGTHNFHNFTSGKPFKDPSAIRFIREFRCEEAYMYDDLEFIVLKVKGQSFMLHQIRKMIGLVIAVAKGFTPSGTIERAFGEQKLDIPRAPGLGLVLERVHYEAYNKRWGSDGLHEPLNWKECEDQLEQFKKEHIYPTIVRTEKKEKSMMQWLQTLPIHTYDAVNVPNPYRMAYTEMAKERQERKDKLKLAEVTSDPQPSTATDDTAVSKEDGGTKVTSTTTDRRPAEQDSGLEEKPEACESSTMPQENHVEGASVDSR